MQSVIQVFVRRVQNKARVSCECRDDSELLLLLSKLSVSVPSPSEAEAWFPGKPALSLARAAGGPAGIHTTLARGHQLSLLCLSMVASLTSLHCC